MAKIKVKAAPSVGIRVALWDVNDEHPNGEIVVSGAKHRNDKGELVDAEPTEAAETAAVLRAIADGRLVVVSGGSAEAREAAATGKQAAQKPNEDLAQLAAGS